MATLLLIFVGALVKSTGSGLAVPDWPLSFGGLFPPMVGGIFYEHGHRMAATLVGFLILCLAVLLARFETRRWVRMLGWAALGMVIFQGLLGGLTVLLFLPTIVSLAHGVLAQTFFMLTILIAYTLSTERNRRLETLESTVFSRPLLKASCGVMGLIYVQLILGGVMRHTESGLAIPDFPTVAWTWLPRFDEAMLHDINVWRFDADYVEVTMTQVVYHFMHRCGAVGVLLGVGWLNVVALRSHRSAAFPKLLVGMDLLLIGQIGLGAMTVLSERQYHLTSLHVMVGAALLGFSTLLLLRTAPLSISALRQTLYN